LRKDGRWLIDVVVWKNGERLRVRKSARAKNKAEAIEAENRERSRLMTSVAFGPSPRLRDFAVEFLDVYAVTNNKPSEVETKRMIVKLHPEPFFGATTIDKIGIADVERYKATKIAAGLSPKYINNHLIVLRRLLAVAVEWGRLGVVPKIKPLRAPR